MKQYLTKFSTRAAYEAELSNLDYPNVSYISGEDSLVYAESEPSPTHDYRIEIYDDLGKDNGQQVDPDQLRVGDQYFVYLYDIANDTYLEDAIDWDLTCDDPNITIGDGDPFSHSSCKYLYSDYESQTMLYATNPVDSSDVYIDQSITVTDA